MLQYTCVDEKIIFKKLIINIVLIIHINHISNNQAPLKSRFCTVVACKSDIVTVIFHISCAALILMLFTSSHLNVLFLNRKLCSVTMQLHMYSESILMCAKGRVRIQTSRRVNLNGCRLFSITCVCVCVCVS